MRSERLGKGKRERMERATWHRERCSRAGVIRQILGVYLHWRVARPLIGRVRNHPKNGKMIITTRAPCVSSTFRFHSVEYRQATPAWQLRYVFKGRDNACTLSNIRFFLLAVRVLFGATYEARLTPPRLDFARDASTSTESLYFQDMVVRLLTRLHHHLQDTEPPYLTTPSDFFLILILIPHTPTLGQRHFPS
ncbi:hypothetical protein CC80DRAFT_498011 [Byssothecium circinans]|uniref:Uncharacterized protein n=1 Tax=Byssothecium circinans TaxID=147558 RepID=A0A6A5TD82_9PLEO|nr:hypothetical protein CC80DRAFT_498011 [Byssothecium circinans]